MSLRGSIDAKCKDCLYDPLCGGGSWREQITACSSVSCPLWPVRPLSREFTAAAAKTWREPTKVAGTAGLQPDAALKVIRADYDPDRHEARRRGVGRPGAVKRA